MMNQDFIPWNEEEGVYAADNKQHMLKKLGMSYSIKFLPKKELKEAALASGATDTEFEAGWDKLRKEGGIVKMLVKRDNEGSIIQWHDGTSK